MLPVFLDVTLRLSADGFGRLDGTYRLYLLRLCLPHGVELHRRRPDVSDAPASIQNPVPFQRVRLATFTVSLYYQ